MTATTNRGITYPVAGDANNVPTHILNVASWVDTEPGIHQYSTAARDALGASAKQTGQVIWNTTTLTLQYWTGAAWADLVVKDTSGHIVTTGNINAGGSLYANGTVGLANAPASGANAAVEVGGGRPDAGAALIDLHGVNGTDYEARIIRNSGANGTLAITQTGTGVITLDSSAGVVVTGPLDARVNINAQTGTTYTLAASDAGKLVTLSNASAITLTIPSGTFSTGQKIDIQQIGAGQVTVATSGTSYTSYGSKTKLAGQYAAGTIICTAANTFTLIGNLA